MKNIILLSVLGLSLISCKNKSADPIPDPASIASSNELSSPLFETEFGDCYDFDDIGRNPLTLLSSNDMIVSSIHFDGVADKLQVSKISSSGNLIWQKNPSYGYKYKAGNCFETQGGNIISIGAAIDQSSWVYSQVYVAKLNPNTGDTIWARHYGHNYIDGGVVGYEDTNLNYWIVDFSSSGNKASLLKVAANGDSLTTVVDSPQAYYSDALVTTNKEIILVGQSATNIASKEPVYITRYINGSKDFSSDIVLTNYDNIQVSDVCQTADGNYVIAGTCFNASNTTIRYGFLLKVDSNGNKMWENILTQFNGSEIASCVEKQADVFYMGIGGYGSGKLYKYDLSNLSVMDNQVRQPDAQLLIKNGKLFRGIIETNASFYETVKVKAYTINN